MEPLAAEQLEPVLRVIEAAQSLAAGDDVPEMLASLSRQLTEFLDASACLVSVVDAERGVVCDRAGYARPPHRWEQAAEEYALADYPRTDEVLRTGEPFSCALDGTPIDPAEARWLMELGYRSLLMLSLPVEAKPYALIEIYDERPRPFTDAELRLASALTAEAGTMVTRARMAERLEDAYFATLGTLAAALEAKDAYTNDHASQIADLAGSVCAQLELNHSDTRIVKLGALLHDIGKIGIPEAILNKPGPLTGEEFAVMKKHPEIGERICGPLKSLRGMLPIIRSHHERPNGSGYPDGLRGEAISLEARIVCLADVYDALATTRSYKRAFTRERCIEILRQDTAKGLFDPVVVEAFAAYLAEREETARGRR